MSGLLLSRIDTALLYPPFLAKLQGLLDEAMAKHQAAYWVISGFRSYTEQRELFAQGRTAPGPKVTNARAGESSHNFGIAGDVCRDGFIDRRGLQPDWRNESYELLRELAPKHGLYWGGLFFDPDRPHLQLPGYINREQLEPLRQAFEAGGFKSVFDVLDGVCRP